jgi:hypothetical protein
LVEAAGAVDAIERTQFALLEFGLELVLECFLTRGIAAPAWVIRVALVAADEQMAFKGGHRGKKEGGRRKEEEEMQKTVKSTHQTTQIILSRNHRRGDTTF